MTKINGARCWLWALSKRVDWGLRTVGKINTEKAPIELTDLDPVAFTDQLVRDGLSAADRLLGALGNDIRRTPTHDRKGLIPDPLLRRRLYWTVGLPMTE